MQVPLKDFKDMLDFLSNKYDISKEWIIRNGVLLFYLICDGLKSHEVDGENFLLSEDVAFDGFCNYIDRGELSEPKLYY